MAVGGALVVPLGLLLKAGYRPKGMADHVEPPVTERIERLAMEAVMAAERRLGNNPRDVGDLKLGYDVESRTPSGLLRLIEVKGRDVRAREVSLTAGEIKKGLNVPDRFILAIARVDGDEVQGPWYVRRPFTREPDFGVTSVNYKLQELLERGGEPS